MVHCHVCKHLDSTEPVKLETCIVVTLSSWKIELTFFISKDVNLSDEMPWDRLVFFSSGQQLKVMERALRGKGGQR